MRREATVRRQPEGNREKTDRRQKGEGVGKKP